MTNLIPSGLIGSSWDCDMDIPAGISRSEISS